MSSSKRRILEELEETCPKCGADKLHDLPLCRECQRELDRRVRVEQRYCDAADFNFREQLGI